MFRKKLSGGIHHDMPADLAKAITGNRKALSTWENISAIARNEWICWTVTVKQEKTRKNHIERACNELAEGKRRPCCWVGCIHRTDKPVSPWAKKVLIDKKPLVR